MLSEAAEQCQTTSRLAALSLGLPLALALLLLPLLASRLLLGPGDLRHCGRCRPRLLRLCLLLFAPLLELEFSKQQISLTTNS